MQVRILLSPLKILDMELEEKIIDYWLNNKDNRVSVIAKKFEVSEYKVSRAINNYLKNKKHYVK